MTPTDLPQSLLERLPLVSYLLELEAPSKALYVSPQFEAAFGLDVGVFEDEDDQVWVGLIREEDRAGFLAALESLRDGATEMAVDYRVRVADGSHVWVRDVARVEDGKIHGYLVDITHEKELEEELAVERATLDAFFNRSRVGLAITDVDGRYVRINEALAHLSGGSPGDFVGRTLHDVRPELAAQIDEQRDRAGDGAELEIDVAWGGGHVHGLVSYFPFDVRGRRYVGRIVVDQTERRRAEAAERRYRELLERLPLVVYVNEIESVRAVTFVSPQIEDLTGYAPEEFVADPSLGDRIIHPDDLAEIQALERAGDVFEHEYRIVRRDGEVRWVLDRMETLRDEHGTPYAEEGFLVDITDRHDTAQLLRAVWNESLDAMVIAGRDGRYVDVNPAACALFGRSYEEIVGRHVDEILGGGAWASYRRGGPPSEYRLSRPDGGQRLFEPAVKPEVLPGLDLAVLRDVTERRELEAEISRAQKLESVGRLAGGVAHDFNNLLTAIGGYAQLLRSRLPEGTTEHSFASEIDGAAERATVLTAQLLALGRRQTLRVRPLDLNRELGVRRAEFQELVGATRELVYELTPGLAAVHADRTLLGQAVVNLLVNAMEATGAGGRIVVSTRNEELDGRGGLAAGTYVVLSVADNGVGIAEENLQHIFEPFFTTKEVGQGRGGLGLASAYGTVRQSGGTMSVDSEPGVGTTFSIYLPAFAPEEDAETKEGRGEMILVVEQNAAVADVAYEVLTDAGYRVLTARTTADAVRLAERYDGGIDALLTDLDRRQEQTLVGALRHRHPALAPLALAKPYTAERLKDAVRRALDRPRNG